MSGGRLVRPARLVLSRKGTDATAGGRPSAILPDGRLLSVPIPERGSGLRYRDVAALRPLGLDGDTEVHLDPDLDPHSLPRPPGWRPLFGQAGAAQRHLRRHGVGVGDLFLFFGWFRHCRVSPSGRLVWARPVRDLHLLWGWLEVGAVVDVRTGRELPWAARHPHLVRPDRPANCVYVAASQCSLAPGLPGAGIFTYSGVLQLTAPDARLRSRWRVPLALHPDHTPTPLSYHADARRWSRDDGHAILHAAPRGQEFVVAATDGLRAWAHDLLRTAGRQEIVAQS